MKGLFYLTFSVLLAAAAGQATDLPAAIEAMSAYAYKAGLEASKINSGSPSFDEEKGPVFESLFMLDKLAYKYLPEVVTETVNEETNKDNEGLRERWYDGLRNYKELLEILYMSLEYSEVRRRSGSVYEEVYRRNEPAFRSFSDRIIEIVGRSPNTTEFIGEHEKTASLLRESIKLAQRVDS